MGKSMMAVLNREDTVCSSKWIVDVNVIVTSLTGIWPHSLIGDSTRF